MILAEMVLPKIAEWRPASGRQTLNLPDASSGWTVSLTVDRADELGCLVWELLLHRTASTAGENTSSLRMWAERVAQRSTGLLEALKVIEVDDTRGEALLRSDEPAKRGEDLFYYEVLLQNAGTASLRRYQALRCPDTRRQPIAFALTHESLAKLIGDLTVDR